MKRFKTFKREEYTAWLKPTLPLILIRISKASIRGYTYDLYFWPIIILLKLVDNLLVCFQIVCKCRGRVKTSDRYLSDPDNCYEKEVILIRLLNIDHFDKIMSKNLIMRLFFSYMYISQKQSIIGVITKLHINNFDIQLCFLYIYYFGIYS